MLGPLLCLIHVDTMQFYTPDTLIMFFADNTVFTIKTFCLSQFIETTNKVLAKLNSLTSSSCLAGNISNTNFMIFCRKGVPYVLDNKIVFNAEF